MSAEKPNTSNDLLPCLDDRELYVASVERLYDTVSHVFSDRNPNDNRGVTISFDVKPKLKVDENPSLGKFNSVCAQLAEESDCHIDYEEVWKVDFDYVQDLGGLHPSKIEIPASINVTSAETGSNTSNDFHIVVSRQGDNFGISEKTDRSQTPITHDIPDSLVWDILEGLGLAGIVDDPYSINAIDVIADSENWSKSTKVEEIISPYTRVVLMKTDQYDSSANSPLKTTLSAVYEEYSEVDTRKQMIVEIDADFIVQEPTIITRILEPLPPSTTLFKQSKRYREVNRKTLKSTPQLIDEISSTLIDIIGDREQ